MVHARPVNTGERGDRFVMFIKPEQNVNVPHLPEGSWKVRQEDCAEPIERRAEKNPVQPLRPQSVLQQAGTLGEPLEFFNYYISTLLLCCW